MAAEISREDVSAAIFIFSERPMIQFRVLCENNHHNCLKKQNSHKPTKNKEKLRDLSKIDEKNVDN